MLLALVLAVLVLARGRGLDALALDGVKLHGIAAVSPWDEDERSSSDVPQRTCRSPPGRRTSTLRTAGLSAAAPQDAYTGLGTHDLLEVLAEVGVVDLDGGGGSLGHCAVVCGLYAGVCDARLTRDVYDERQSRPCIVVGGRERDGGPGMRYIGAPGTWREGDGGEFPVF